MLYTATKNTKSRTSLLLVILGIWLLYLPPTAYAHGSHVQQQKTNNDRIIAAQQFGQLRPDVGKLSLTYYGNMAFRIETPGGLVVFIDPWRNDTNTFVPWFQAVLPETEADIVLVTHAHYDHNATDRVSAGMVLDRMAGQFSLGDVTITGIADKHVCEPQGKYPYRAGIIYYLGEDPCPPNETTQWNNTMYVIETGGMRLLHWGDNRQNPPEEIWNLIGQVDIAILPISTDGHNLGIEWVNKIVDRLKAKIVIPSHYAINGLHIPGVYRLESAEGWVKERSHTNLGGPTLDLSSSTIHQYDNHIMYFGDYVAFPVHITRNLKWL